MIVFDLQCAAGHRFEVWVPSAESLDRQITRRLVACPQCDSTEVQRLPAAPAVASTRADDATSDPKPISDEMVSLCRVLWQALRQLSQNAEDVGLAFALEARRIHRGEAPPRPIRGQAERNEVEALLDEGILVLPLPPSDKDIH